MRVLATLAGVALLLLCGLGTASAAGNADVRYSVTNGGQDAGGKSRIDFFPAGRHDGPIVDWTHSGATVHLPEGTYNVRISFSDGKAHKEMWLDNQAFAGKVEKTVEVAVPVTAVRYVITNGGEDVRGKARIDYYPAGKHDGPTVDWASSGDTEHLLEGTYNVHVSFNDGKAHKELWFDDQAFAGKVEKTVEVDVKIATVRYLVTNGGQDVGGRARLDYYPAGQHNGPVVDWAKSGDTERLPEGTYNVRLTFNDGTAHKELWFDDQAFAGNVEKTVEVGVKVAEVRYVVTNQGQDAGSKARVDYFPAGNHAAPIVTWANSGESVRLPEASYDVRVTFSDGSARREKWFDNQAFAGKVDRTVEVGVAIAEVRYFIVNGGENVGDRGQVHYYPDGNHDSSISWATSGETTRLPDGTYSVQVTFSDGAAHKELWFDHQSFSGRADETVDMALPLADVRYVLTNDGTDVGDKGEVHFYPAGDHANSVTWARSGETTRLAAGKYSVLVTFRDGEAHKEKWLDNVTLAGKLDQTVEIGVAVADVRYVITNGGVDVRDKGQAHFFPAGSRNNGVTWIASGDKARLPAGHYDVQVTFTDGLVHNERWLNDQDFSANVDNTVELGLTLAHPTVTVTQDGTDAGTAAAVTYLAPAGNHEFGSVANDQPTVVEAGTYDIRARLGTGEGWLRAAAVAGTQHLTVALQQPAAEQKCVVPQAIALNPPAAAPERIAAATGNFPYLTPLPGSQAGGGKLDTAPVYVHMSDAQQPELVGNGSIVKWYRAPPCVSLTALVGLYRTALLGAGWTIVNEFHHAADAGLTAHFGQHGRNLWGMLHAADDGYALAVADTTVAVGQLVADLDSKCHLALTGVLFDFDKSSLKPESDPILAQVAAMLSQVHTLRLDVQGHTDNVGGDAYNQRLSEARSHAVLLWLTQHGVAADRLSAHGFGKTRPVAPNTTEEGRARNRRVEIANPACVGKG